MLDQKRLANNLLDFIYESPSSFHAVQNVKKFLSESGFIELNENEKWNIKKGGKYFTTKNLSAIIAFTIGKEIDEQFNFKIVGAHTDSPSFRIKPNAEIKSEGKYLKLNTEVYGGPILSTWFDRPLSLAGRVVIKGKCILQPETKLLNIKRPVLIIPNLAIHMNRKVNSGIEINPQKDTLPILGIINGKMENEEYLINLICEELLINKDEILDFDLFLYEYEKGCIMGLNNEFISSGRLDDLAMVYAGMISISEAEKITGINILACFDNEEVGSSTKQGADSPFLSNTLERISIAMNKNREDFMISLAKSFMISSDSAHAVHPNYSEKADPVLRPIINNGPVIKISARQSYTSDAFSIGVYEGLCKENNIPYQKFTNRSDEPGGSTIGPISSTHLSINTVDIGSPILAMHSVRELGGVEDQSYITKSFLKFYEL